MTKLSTLSYSPPEYLILGSSAQQGNGHNSFSTGLLMLSLFSGKEYFEIFENPKYTASEFDVDDPEDTASESDNSFPCPTSLLEQLSEIWESHSDFSECP